MRVQVVLVVAVCVLSSWTVGCGGGQSASSPSPAGPGGIPITTTLSAETANNTSAADSFVAQPNGNAGAGNISKQPIQSLLYPGSTTKIYAHLVGWFGSSGHTSVGYQSNDAGQVHKQVADMMSRGLAGVIVDWHGAGSTTINATTMLIKSEAEAQNGKFQFAIMEDSASLSASAASNRCDATDQVISDLNLIASQFEGSPAYLVMDGRPVVFFFGVDTYYIDWNRVASSVMGNPILLFRGKTGLAHAQGDGAFQWEDHSSSDPYDRQLAAQDQFYSAAVASPSLLAFGSAYAGFNDTLAAWGTDRLTHRDCGQTWLDSLSEVGQFYSSGKQLAALQLVTWNDYEEGTEIESGIDNCIYLTPSISGSVFHWSVGGGDENTVDHYTVFISSDGQNLAKLGDVPAGSHSFDLSSAPLGSGTYDVFVKAVGKASFQNKMSPPIAYHAGDRPPEVVVAIQLADSLTVRVNTDGSSDPDGPIASSSVDFGDGTVLSGPHASHTYATAGIYNITTTVVDPLGASSVAVNPVSVKATASGVNIISPTTGTAVNWPTTFVVSANMANPVSSMTILVDGTAVYSIHSDVINTPLKINQGAHHITVQATDSTGATASSSVDITAEPTDLAPIADVAVFPLANVGPRTVVACTTNSSDPDGFINARQVSFSDGTTIKAAGAVHTFSAAGSYSATATVSDQYGASDTAVDNFTIP